MKTFQILKTTLTACFVLLGSLSIAAKNDAMLFSLINMMTGSYNSSRQAAQDSVNFYDISLLIQPVNAAQTDTDNAWLYVEQWYSQNSEITPRQYIYHLQQKSNDTIVNYIYEIQKNIAAPHANDWLSYASLNNIALDSLQIRKGCEVYITATDWGFKGSTRQGTCPSNYNGAIFATSEIMIMPDKILRIDKGINADGFQVWGIEKGPYIFEKTQQYNYPFSRRDTKYFDTYFGKKIADPYHWLQDENAAETQQWVNAQNTFTEQYFAEFPFREQMRNALTKVWNFPKQSVPKQEGAFLYFTKNDGLQAQSILYRQKNIATPEVVLDPNTFSADGTVSLNGYRFSHDGRYMAYTIAKGGSDWREIFVLDTQTGKRLDDHLSKIKFSGIAWHKDGFFYSRYENVNDKNLYSEKNQQLKLYYHQLGDAMEKDKLIYEDAKPLRSPYGYTLDNERFLFLSLSESTDNNMLYVRPMENSEKTFLPIVEDLQSNVDAIGSWGDTILLHTDRDAPNWRLCFVTAQQPNIATAKNIIPESELPMSEIHLVQDKILVKYKKDVADVLWLYDKNGKKISEIPLPGFGTVSNIETNPKSSDIYYSFTSYIYPPNIYRYNINTNENKLLIASQSSFNPAEYVSRQVFYTSKDGTKIPMTITHKKDVAYDGNNPCLLYGYGGFNISINPQFDVSKQVFLENGGIYAVANLRGGSEYGETWHQAGMLHQKQNVFDDMIAAAEYLCSNSFTNPQKLAISGRSNGGLLVGAVITQRPDLFKVALPAVGVMDMLKFQQFTIGWAWVGEYGSSDNAEDFAYLYQYSPYHNLKENTQYPATLITTADHDDRVVPAHSYKFAAQMQHCQAADSPVLIRIDTKAGHGYGKSTQQYIDENTDIMCFLFYNLGMNLH
ncbi:MAG: CpcT/CpeT family chromophore lyase [Chitinophagales bacterium]|nr:prolyl oligopeptidase family serine peptidase [Bacteroidota bacterium]MCB9043877.1 prolyl oligopeptidase family serine peptidase [Chitinophagales bacterium]